MAVLMQLHQKTDDIDKIVDTLLADPNSAEDVKDALRKRLLAKTTEPVEASRRDDDQHDDADDMWDNVPV